MESIKVEASSHFKLWLLAMLDTWYLWSEL